MTFSSFHLNQDVMRPGRGRAAQAGFTMIEIAICLAIIGVALVAIIGVLPLGMNMQRDNGQETVINQDASIFLEAIRNGSLAQDDLTNYVYAITNFSVYYTAARGKPTEQTYGTTSFPNGAAIVGMLSTPQFVSAANFWPIPNVYNGGISNHIVAYVRSISGSAIEKPPQDNDILREDTFSYHVYCVNEPMAVNTNVLRPGAFEYQMANNLHELRLRFLYPVLPNGKVGAFHLTYRTLVSGRVVMQTNFFANANQVPYLYHYEPQNYTNKPTL
jgi:prepilin-type N-terminal cleavage/methylation domain-containing protein